MATTKTIPAAPVGEAVLLRDCLFGKADQLVILSPEDLACAVEQGMADPHPDAIAAALAAKE